MRNRNRILNLMLILEAVVLVIVLVIGLMRSGLAHFGNQSSETIAEEEEAENAEEQNAVDSDAASESDEESEETEEETDNNITDTGSAYEAMVFSDEVMEKLDQMTPEQKAAQLFVTTPDALTGLDGVTVAGDTTLAALETYPVGGIVYSSENIQGAEQVASLISNTQEYAENAVGVSIFAMIEELGGTEHSPLANVLDTISAAESPSTLGAQGDPNQITAAAQLRADYVKESGFNTILGPIADISTNGQDADFDGMTYGDNTGNVAELVEYDIEGIQEEGVMAVMRAFPGTYDVTTDYSVYQVGINAGVDCIMVSNQPDDTLTGEEGLPCSLSVQVVQQLRMDMGFEGLLMTSDLDSDVVTNYCSTAEAAVRAVNAGIDLIYVQDNFQASYEAVLNAVNDGSITENILNNAVGRILTRKMG